MNHTHATTKNSAMSAFDNIKAGLEQAIEFQRNTLADKPNVAKAHRMPELDVKTVREQTGLTQAKFAQTFAISLGTLRHWERGDRKPSGTALVLLHAVNKRPKTVMKLLALHRHRPSAPCHAVHDRAFGIHAVLKKNLIIALSPTGARFLAS